LIDLVLQAFQTLFAPEHFAFLILGVLLGLVIGVFPGLGGIAGLSLLLPFLYGMDEVSALATLVGLVAVIPTSATLLKKVKHLGHWQPRFRLRYLVVYLVRLF